MGESRRQHAGNFPLALTLLPCGEVDKTELEALARALAAQGIGASLGKPAPLPRSAFDPRRRQYRADDLLAMARHQPGARLLVVTDCDLFSDRLNFVLGLAGAPGKHAVISLFRLRAGGNQEIFRRRALKEAVHELGHMLGLDHCAKPHCVMYFSNCLDDTDRKASDWCAVCEKTVQTKLSHASESQSDGGALCQP